MRVLGIDPGLEITGYGAIEYQKNNFSLIESGIIKTNKAEKTEIRLKKIYDDLSGILKELNPEVIVLEKLFAHYRHPITAYILGHVRGIICLLATQNNIRLIEYLPTRVKKVVVGNGHASKEQVQKMVLNILKINAIPSKFDITDALALAMSYCYIQRVKL